MMVQSKRTNARVSGGGLLRTASGALFLVAGSLALLSCAHEARPVSPSDVSRAEPPPADASRADLLATLTLAARGAGSGEPELITSGIGAAGDTLEGFALVAAGRCALLAARGGPSVEDLDLFAFADDGALAGSDEHTDNVPTVLTCAKEDTRLLVGARVARGTGPVALAVYDVPAEREEAVRRASGARPLSLGSVDPEGWPGMHEAISKRRTHVGGQWTETRRVPVPVDARLPSQLSAEIPAGRCLDVLALPSEELARLEFEVFDRAGRTVGRSAPSAREPSLVLCAEGSSESVTLALRPHGGRGVALVLLATTQSAADRKALDPEVRRVDLWPAGTSEAATEPGTALPSAASGKLTLPPPAAAPAKAAPAKAEPGKKAPAPTPNAFSLLPGQGRYASRALGAGGCRRLELSPRAPLLGYRALIATADGSIVSELESSRAQDLYVCAKGALRLDTLALHRGGPLDVRVVDERDFPPLLLEHPRAASRLLARLADLGWLEHPAGVGQVTTQDAGPSAWTAIDYEVPAARCLTWFGALDGSARGLEVRLIDRDAELDLETVRDGVSLHARACAAPAATLRLRVLVRTLAAPSKMLVTTRLTD